ncbi:M14 family zinc carboxypeptidase [Ichthyenterobacterium magnum]|uniref:Putative secreted protein (Por secretion system target) n=1 Tax=Ichthyenterobacterium magnum TaxID=1230530 RepID=A0A420DL45_9FLAO|nr:M14 family zinc carboxypeptidase [Ichthyenterobacterium magnum]RKE94939.1 putative secreted protein (Por secretion system target) [Ichthyenterobacterium magnum]
MKKITLMFVVLILTSFSIHSQSTNLQKAQQYIEAKGEVCFVFTANNEAQVQEISSFLPLGHKVNRETLEIEAYGNSETFERFLSYGLPYVVNQSDNEVEYSDPEYDTLAWDTTWDAYPSYSDYVAKMNYYATTYPSICTLETIGTTVNGRALLMLKISDNVSTNEAEPEFMYTSSMHGDELTGFPLMIRLIDYLLTNYGSDTEVDNIINSTVLYINPLANPDGAYDGGNSNLTDSPTRANANGQDLNRNYPDNQEVGRINFVPGTNTSSRLHYSEVNDVYEPETLAFMNFEESHNIVLSANFHGGTEVMNYPYDNTYDKHADHNYYEHICQEWVDNIRATSAPSNYFNIEYDSPENPASPGVTQGSIWYVVYGGRQDYMNYFRHSKEVTVEISDNKKVSGSQLPNHWNYNKQAFLDYIKQVHYGFQGTITDESGNPIAAKISIAGHDELNSYVFSNADFGDYYRLIEGGTYTVTFEAPGYATQNISVTVTDDTKTVQNVTMVATTALPTASNVTIGENESAALSASGTGVINWYQNVNDASPLATGTSYNTPILTTTTSYFVEDVIAMPNVGSTESTSNGGFFGGGTTDRYLVFSATEAVKLTQVTINAEQPGEIEVQLQDSSGNMMDSRVILVESAGVQQIDLDFFIPVGTDMRLASAEMSVGFKMYRNNSGASYPYTNGAISITDNNIGNPAYYYFFYDWKIESIKSARKEVIVTVDDTLSLTDTNQLSDASVYPNPFSNSINIKLPSQYTSNSISVQLLDVSGRIIVNMNNLNSQNGIYRLNSLDKLSTGTYFVKITDNEQTNTVVKRLIKQ